MGIFARAFARGTSFGRAFVRSHATSLVRRLSSCDARSRRRERRSRRRRFSKVSRGRASTLTKILDGSVWHLEGRKGELVGEDELANKYYRDVSSQQGRNRWVVPPNADDYSAANVPRGWHGWLHHANDEPGLPDAAAPTYE